MMPPGVEEQLMAMQSDEPAALIRAPYHRTRSAL
jgi:hypothetical protein